MGSAIDPAKMAKQAIDWERDRKGGEAGNPFATLCDACHGRHAPPRNELCPTQVPA